MANELLYVLRYLAYGCLSVISTPTTMVSMDSSQADLSATLVSRYINIARWRQPATRLYRNLIESSTQYNRLSRKGVIIRNKRCVNELLMYSFMLEFMKVTATWRSFNCYLGSALMAMQENVQWEGRKGSFWDQYWFLLCLAYNAWMSMHSHVAVSCFKFNDFIIHAYCYSNDIITWAANKTSQVYRSTVSRQWHRRCKCGIYYFCLWYLSPLPYQLKTSIHLDQAQLTDNS